MIGGQTTVLLAERSRIVAQLETISFDLSQCRLTLALQSDHPDRGYSMEGLGAPTVYSTGYADDTAAVASSWSEARLQHMWILDFFVAHHLRLNASKTKCVVSSRFLISGDMSNTPVQERAALAPGMRFLPNIDPGQIHDPAAHLPASPGSLSSPTSLESPDILTLPPSHAFRYLGYMFRADLQSEEMVAVLSGRVWAECKNIKRYRLSLVEASDHIREYLYPRLELGLIFARVSSKVMASWDGLIRSAVLHTYPGTNVSSVAGPAVRLALDILPIWRHAELIRGVEFGNALRSSPELHSRTSWCRFRQSIAGKKIKVVATSDGWSEVIASVDSRKSRWSGVVKSLLKLGVKVTFRTPSLVHRPVPCFTWCDHSPPSDPSIGCPVLPAAHHALQSTVLCPPCVCPRTITVFTDGSFIEPGASGYAAVVCGEPPLPCSPFHHSWCVTLSGGSPVSGASYAAECAAILTTLRLLPANCPIVIYTDSKSGMQSVARDLIGTSRRLRLGCRAMILTIRSIIDIRASHGAPTDFVHVKSHICIQRGLILPPGVTRLLMWLLVRPPWTSVLTMIASPHFCSARRTLFSGRLKPISLATATTSIYPGTSATHSAVFMSAGVSLAGAASVPAVRAGWPEPMVHLS